MMHRRSGVQKITIPVPGNQPARMSRDRFNEPTQVMNIGIQILGIVGQLLGVDRDTLGNICQLSEINA